MTPIHLCRVMAASVVVGCALVAPATATTLIDDPFTDGARTEGADSLDTDWWLNITNSLTSVSVAPDATIGSGNSLQVVADNSGGSSTRVMVGSFEQQTLGDRDKLVLTFDFRVEDSDTGSERFRFGLLDDGGDPLTSDVASVKTGHTGYFSRVSVGAGNTNADTRESLDSVDNIISGNGTGEIVENNGLGGIADTDVHSARFTVTHTTDSGEIDLRTRLDNRFLLLGRDTINLRTTFNEVAIGSIGELDYALDNIRLERWRASIDDTFDVGATPARTDDGDDPLDVGWVTRSDVVLSVISDDNGVADANTGEIAAGNAMFVDTDGTFAKVGAAMESFDLELVGSKAYVAFDVRFNDDPAGANDSDGFRFGIWDNAGTALVDGDVPFNTADNDDDGYMITLGLGTAGAELNIETDTNGILGGGGDPSVGTGTFAGFSDGNQHLVELMVERVIAGLRFTLFVDGTQVFDLTDAAATETFFNQIGFATNGQDFLLDNIVVDSMVVPTPAALPAGLGLIGLIAARRRRRRR